jgi:hypothetical protein
LLPKLYYCHRGSIKKLGKKNVVKKTNRKNLVKMVKSKSICPKWHFVQVGHGGKKTIGGVFLLKLLVKKVGISCSGFTHGMGVGRISLQ